MSNVTLLLALAIAGEPDRSLSIQPSDDVRRVTVTARIPAALDKSVPAGQLDGDVAQRWLTFSLVGDNGKPGPAIFGKYRRDGDRLTFTPRYGLVPGQRYRATFLPAAGKAIHQDYRVPPRERTPPAVVARVFPTADVLPANQLKFYLHFSKPMREGPEIFDRIQLLDEDGKPVHDPWRRTELWDEEARRFTLWIHPGRVKKGVNLREEFGPVLDRGKSYTLVIGADVQDAAGQPLGKRFVKKFKATKEDVARPLPQKWQLAPPRAGTREAVKLDFGEPLDEALLHRCLDVRDAQGRRVSGRIRLGDKQARWTFRPKGDWKSGPYTVHVDPILEDLAGNTPLRVFDTDLQRPQGEKPVLQLRFRPR